MKLTLHLKGTHTYTHTHHTYTHTHKSTHTHTHTHIHTHTTFAHGLFPIQADADAAASHASARMVQDDLSAALVALARVQECVLLLECVLCIRRCKITCPLRWLPASTNMCVCTEQEQLAYRESKCRGQGVRGCHKLLRTKREHSFEYPSLRRHHKRLNLVSSTV